MNELNIFAVCIIILTVIVVILVLILLRMSKYLRNFLKESLYTQEILITSGDYVGEKIEGLQKDNQSIKRVLSELTKHVNSDTVNKNLRMLLKQENDYNTEIKKEIERVISLLSVMNEIRGGFDSVAGNIVLINESMQKSFEAFQERIASISEINTRLEDIAVKTGSLGEGRILADDLNVKLEEITNGISSLNDSIRVLSGSGVSSAGLTKEQVKSINELKNSIANLVKFAGDMQGAITMHNGSIESTFLKTEDSLRRLIMNVTDRIEKDYRDNLEVMFKAMDKNLRAILDRLIDDINKKKG